MKMFHASRHSSICLFSYFSRVFLLNIHIYIFNIDGYVLLLQTPRLRIRGHTPAQMRLVVRAGASLQNTHPERPVPRGKREDEEEKKKTVRNSFVLFFLVWFGLFFGVLFCFLVFFLVLSFDATFLKMLVFQMEFCAKSRKRTARPLLLLLLFLSSSC